MKPSKDLDEQKLDEILEDFYDGDIRQSDMGKAKQAILDWHNKQTLELLDRLEEKFKDSERRSGQGSRPQFSKETETPGEYRSRSKGFKSGMLVALNAIENERKKL